MREMLHELAQGLADTGRIARDAVRLLWRHWPVLLTVFLLGEAARHALMWAALRLGDLNAWAASAVVPLAPLAAMIAMVFMLRTLKPSLGQAQLSAGAEQTVGPEPEPEPEAEAEPEPEPGPEPESAAVPTPAARGRLARARSAWLRRLPQTERLRQGLTFLASVLVPFIAVYQTQGYFEEDRQRFVNESFAATLSDSGLPETGSGLAERTIYGSGTVVILAALLAALLVRRVMDRTGWARRGLVWAGLAVWIEVFWLTWLASFLSSAPAAVEGWASGRVFVAWVQDAWERAVQVLGPVGSGIEAIWTWLGGLWADVGVLAFTPLAWLAVGAVVYSRPATSRAPLVTLTRLQRLRRIRLLRQRAAAAPEPVRAWSAQAGKRVTSRFTALWDGLRTIRRAGAVPVILFCLMFLLVRQVEVLAGHALRAVIGPLQPEAFVVLAPILSILPRAAYTLALVALLAAAVDRMLRHEVEEEVADAAGAERGLPAGGDDRPVTAT